MIDLHLHTTASDGTLRPADLVAHAAAAGITTLSVTDHDTTAGLAEARGEADRLGLRFISGIEITAVEDGRDTHILGYFVDAAGEAFAGFLAGQRQDRVRRVREMAERLEALGAPIDAGPLVASGLDHGRSIGRPHVAAALVARGHVRTHDEAFERYLDTGQPAFVPRSGASAAQVIDVIHQAGGVAALAHPGPSRSDRLIPGLAASGLDAIEVRHSDHDEAAEARYRALAATLGLAVSGGSDFHGEASGRSRLLGTVFITADDLAGLEARRR